MMSRVHLRVQQQRPCTPRSDGRFLVELWSSYSQGLVLERPAAALKFSVTAIRVA